MAEFRDSEIIKENGGFYADGEYYDMEYDTTPLITENQINKINTLIGAVTKTSDYDSTIYAIVNE